MATTAHAVFDAVRAKLEALSGLSEAPVYDIERAPKQAGKAWFYVELGDDSNEGPQQGSGETVRELEVIVSLLASYAPQKRSTRLGDLLTLAAAVETAMAAQGAFTSAQLLHTDTDTEEVGPSACIIRLGFIARYIRIYA